MTSSSQPLVSIVIANYQGLPHLERTLRSVLAQTYKNLEVIVSDDGSTDGSIDLVEAMARAESRLRLLRAERNGGPSRARNRALDAARGTWISVVDSDDLVHPDRTARLLAFAAETGADMVADDLLHFASDGNGVCHSLLADAGFPAVFSMDAELFVRGNTGGSGLPAFGYLKPVIRADRLAGLRYQEGLHVGEDFDLLLRLILSGARFQVLPEPLYLYRRHPGSISHRLSPAKIEGLLRNQESLERDFPDIPTPMREAFARRRAGLARGLLFERLIEAVKGKRLPSALGILSREPGLAVPLARSFTDGLRRRRAPAGATAAGTDRTVTLSLIDIAAPSPAADNTGAARVIVVSPPASAGVRWPFSKIRAVVDAAASARRVLVHGADAAYVAGYIPHAVPVEVAAPAESRQAAMNKNTGH